MKIENTDELIKKMMIFYNVFSMNELAEKISISQPAISKWKKTNAVSAVKKKCRDLGIYNEIFGDIQNINNISGGQNAQNVYGNQNHSEKNEPEFIPEITLDDLNSLFKLAEKKNSVDELADELDDFMHIQKKKIKAL